MKKELNRKPVLLIRYAFSFLLIPACCLFFMPLETMARQTGLTGTFSLEQGYESNVFHTENDPESQWTTSLIPVLELTSEGRSDQIGISYSPDYNRNHRTDDYDVTHDAALSIDKEISSHLNASISNNFKYVNNQPREVRTGETLEMKFARAADHYQAEVVRILFPEITWAEDRMTFVLSELSLRYNNATAADQAEVDTLLASTVSNERQRHWSNELAFSAEYEYAKDSILAFGYTFNVLENKTAGLTDTKTHNPDLLLSYRFNNKWLAEAAYSFENTTYDGSPDKDVHDLDYAVDFQATTNDLLTAEYSISSTDYEETTSDQTYQSGGLSWDRTIDSRTNFSAAADANYIARASVSNDRGYGVELDLSREIEQGEFSFGADYAYTETDTGGSWDNLNESWNFSGGVTYQLQKDLSSDINLAYEKRYAWSGATKTTFNDYTAGLDLTWSFAQWYALSLNYDYSRTETDSASLEDYDNHKIFATFSIAKELWRR